MNETKITLAALWIMLMLTYLLGDVLRIFSGDFKLGEMSGKPFYFVLTVSPNKAKTAITLNPLSYHERSGLGWGEDGRCVSSVGPENSTTTWYKAGLADTDT